MLWLGRFELTRNAIIHLPGLCPGVDLDYRVDEDYLPLGLAESGEQDGRSTTGSSDPWFLGVGQFWGSEPPSFAALHGWTQFKSDELTKSGLWGRSLSRKISGASAPRCGAEFIMAKKMLVEFSRFFEIFVDEFLLPGCLLFQAVIRFPPTSWLKTSHQSVLGSGS